MGHLDAKLLSCLFVVGSAPKHLTLLGKCDPVWWETAASVVSLSLYSTERHGSIRNHTHRLPEAKSCRF